MRRNLYRLRTQQRLSLRVLAARMAGNPGALSHSSIGEVERGVRRCDVDELTSLSVALGVSPLTLLMPYAEHPRDDVFVTGVPSALKASEVLRWLKGDAPYHPESVDAHGVEEFRRRATPFWDWMCD